MHHIECYTDGGCAPTNPGIGGWGVKLMCPAIGLVKELSGGFTMTTNNRMELTAAISAIEALKPSFVKSVTLFSDSKYVTDAFNKGWINGWVASNWKHGELLNMDLWQRLYALANKYSVQFVWVKAHNGDPHNERVDALCAVGRSMAVLDDLGYTPQSKQTKLAI